MRSTKPRRSPPKSPPNRLAGFCVPELVGPEHTASFVGSGRIAVLATRVMINVMPFGHDARRMITSGSCTRVQTPPRAVATPRALSALSERASSP